MTDSVTSQTDQGELADLAQISDKDELLALLQDVHVPEVSSWPAPGVLILIMLFIICCIAFWLYKKRKRAYAQDAWRREALATLHQLQEDLPNATDSDRHIIVQQASSLLRRVMMHVRGRTQVAGLTADAWLRELSLHSDSMQLDEALHPLLTDVPYQTEPSSLETSSNVDNLLSWLHQAIDDLPHQCLSSSPPGKPS